MRDLEDRKKQGPVRIVLLAPLAVSSVVMYRKIRLGFLAIILLLCLSLDWGAEGQLNFSTGWGKRSQRVGVGEWGAARAAECVPQARPSLEQLLAVYNLIQTEALRMLDCRKLNK